MIHRPLCLVDFPLELARAFESLGRPVLEVRTPDTPFFDIAAHLDELGVVPAAILQRENLASRRLLTGLERMDCPTLFWAIDPHLNGFWHSAYGRLFDLVCSTQARWTKDLKADGVRDVRWLPWFGQKRDQKPWVERAHGLCFVGRVSAQRPARQWMIDFLREHGAAMGPDEKPAIAADLTFEEMLALYGDSRLAPNESIFGEINFRLFEAASCGCLVLDQRLGPEQAELFEPGKEIATYDHVLELAELLERFRANPRMAGVMAGAAHQRVLAQHLPEHRAARLLEYLDDTVQRRATGDEAAKWLWITAHRLRQAGRASISAGAVLRGLGNVAQDADVATALLQLLAESGDHGHARENARTVLASGLGKGDLMLDLTGAMVGLGPDGVEDADLARGFWLRRVAGRPDPGSVPRERNEILAAWSRELSRAGRVLRPGFPFDPASHLPACAAECLLGVLHHEPEHLETLRRLDGLLRPVPGTEQSRVGFLSILTLHERKDWRLGLEIGLADLKSYRLESGLEELRIARSLAAEADQTAPFDRALKGRDPSGLLLPKLGA